MPSTRWPHWFRLSGSASRSVRKAPTYTAARPCLETLETREAPAVITGVTVSNQNYDLLSQHETVTANVAPSSVTEGVAAALAGTIPGTVSITDNGQTQSVPISAGPGGTFQAVANFTFSLFAGQEQPNAHTVSATYGGGSIGGVSFSADPVGMSATAGATTFQFLFQLGADFFIAHNVLHIV
jgi:hypothetical protein